MKSNAIVTLLGIADSTLRKYAQAYSEYLSPTGNVGGAGRHRDYTEHDVRVLKLICDMKAQKIGNDDISVTLQSLQNGGWDRLPDLDDNAKALVPLPGALLAAQADRGILQREIELLREQLDALKVETKSAVAAKDDRITELERRLSRSETMLELYESGRLKPSV
jgi:DNA-binding transcriptional MerR regulator